MDLESELFEDIYGTDTVDHAASVHYLKGKQDQTTNVNTNTSNKTSMPIPSPTGIQNSFGVTKPIENPQGFMQGATFKDFRDYSDQQVYQQTKHKKDELRQRIDNTVALVFSKRLHRPVTKSLMFRGGPASILNFESNMMYNSSSASQVSNSTLESSIAESVLPEGYNYGIESILKIYDIDKTEFGDQNLQVILNELKILFKSDKIEVPEMHVYSVVSLLLSYDSNMVRERTGILKAVVGTRKAPAHLYILEMDPFRIFPVARACSALVRALILYYQLGEYKNILDQALKDIKRTVELICGVILEYFPSLRSGRLSKENDITPLHESTTVVVRCAVEEVIAVPMYLGLLRPIYMSEPLFADLDRKIYDTCCQWTSSGQPKELLMKLELSQSLLSNNQRAVPFKRTVDAIGIVLNPPSTRDFAPTAQARLLVHALRSISHEAQLLSSPDVIGADDMLPIFIYATMWCNPVHLYSLSHWLEHITAPQLMSSEAGYSLTMLQTATQVILSFSLQIHQILCGRDIARDIQINIIHQYAQQMANYVYIIVDETTRDAFAVDPAWDTEGVFKLCEANRWHLRKVFFTHRHFDHTGGIVPKYMTNTDQPIELPGLRDFVKRNIPVYVGEQDVAAVAQQTALDVTNIRVLKDGDEFPLGGETLRTLTTPGHTPGSVCFVLIGSNGAKTTLFTGDTLFIGSCGRCDLPESNPRDMLASLDKLARLPEEVMVLPGHNYSFESSSTIGLEKELNGMMIQAMENQTKTSGPTREPVCAMLRLPDYLGVCMNLVDAFHRHHYNHSRV